ncbi:AAA family ATPase [uncultured Secundilactobacillus sp.]|uniref:AAA family ATPase n=1 Tax=uncultured Secundilactobacillus sp. TaxID=2813935 RepID=UPI00258486CE|nr:ATP-dependent Clp protease ATP-binding subunit [uncultured Secundilactobacillus sp.]
MSPQELVEKYAQDLTKSVQNDLDNYQAIGRETEIEDLIVTLSRKRKHNPLLIGEPGVGKTALVEGLAKRIVLQEVPERLKNTHIWVIELAGLMNGERPFLGLFRDLIMAIKDYYPQDLIFIDELHTIVGAGASGKQGLDAGNVLKPALARGEIQLIGATTIEEFHDYIEPDGALTRRFEVLQVSEPNTATVQQILTGVRPSYERYHHVKVSDDALTQVVSLATRYLTDRYMPDKALDLLDESCADTYQRGQTEVTRERVAQVLERRTGIPMTSILRDRRQRLARIQPIIERRIKGQANAVAEVTDAVAISFAGLEEANRPISSFLFLGTPGTGKTEMAKALSEALFDDENAMIRLDLSEFADANSAQRLIGTAHQRGILTEQVKHQPYAVVLLDEIEKGDRSVQDLFLQILSDGIVHDHYGRPISFRNTIIVMTTNLAAGVISDEAEYNTMPDNDQKALAFETNVEGALQTTFRPEFINRIEHKIVFNMLRKPVVEAIAKKYLAELQTKLAGQGYDLTYDPQVPQFLADVGYNLRNGARPLAFMTHQKVTAPLARIILQLEQTGNPDHIQRFHAEVKGRWPNKHDRFGTRHLVFEAN